MARFAACRAEADGRHLPLSLRWGGRRHGGYVEFLTEPEEERLDSLVQKFEELLKAEGDYRPADRLACRTV